MSSFINPTRFIHPPLRATVSDIQEHYVVEGHAAEGFMVNHNGSLILFFRLDDTATSDHVSNGGRIVMQVSSDEGDTWSDPATIFDNEYDNRNVHGGITRDNRIVLFFSDYDAAAGRIGQYFMYSDNGGDTWSTRTEINTEASAFSTGKMDYIPEIDRYIMGAHRPGYNELRFSKDGSDWTEYQVVADYLATEEYVMNEMAVAYIGDGNIIIIARDNDRPHAPHYQMTSGDFGETWSDPQRTNVPKNYGRTAPFLSYDKDTGILILATSDRRSQFSGNPEKAESVFIYANRASDIVEEPQKWSLQETFTRPTEDPNMRFYGYPHLCRIATGEYVGIFTDNLKVGEREQAGLYQFRLHLETAFVL